MPLVPTLIYRDGLLNLAKRPFFDPLHLHNILYCLVGASINDSLCLHGADFREGFKLFFGCCVDVHLLTGCQLEQEQRLLPGSFPL